MYIHIYIYTRVCVYIICKRPYIFSTSLFSYIRAGEFSSLPDFLRIFPFAQVLLPLIITVSFLVSLFVCMYVCRLIDFFPLAHRRSYIILNRVQRLPNRTTTTIILSMAEQDVCTYIRLYLYTIFMHIAYYNCTYTI